VSEVSDRSEILKPYPNEHACRLKEPDAFQSDSFRRIQQGKLHIIIGRLKGERTTTAQAYRYPVDDWSEADARAHCQDAGGSFAAAKKLAFSKQDLELFDQVTERTRKMLLALGTVKGLGRKVFLKQTKFTLANYPEGLPCAECNQPFQEDDSLFELVVAQFGDGAIITEIVCGKCYEKVGMRPHAIDLLKEKIVTLLRG
jgi:hypothetical protein